MFTGDSSCLTFLPILHHGWAWRTLWADYLDSLKSKEVPCGFCTPPGTERREIMRRGLNASLCFIMKMKAGGGHKTSRGKTDMTLYELTGKMRWWKIRAASWEISPAAQKWFVVGECMAHAIIQQLGKVSRYLEDGVWRYRRSMIYQGYLPVYE